MTAFPGSIDQTESNQGVKVSYSVGTGGVTVGLAVKLDPTTANTVIATTADTDIIVGVARDTVAAGGVVTVLSDGCKVKTDQTITLGGKVGISPVGVPETYATGSVLGYCVDGSTLASLIRIQIQY